MMIGGDLPHPRARRAKRTRGDARLVARATSRCRPTIRSAPTLKDHPISTVRAGEIVGIAGVSGNGQKELLAALSGERAARRAVPGRASAAIDVGRLDAGDAGARSASRFVPEERLGRGAVPEMSLADNALLTAHRDGMVRRGFVIDSRRRAPSRARCIERFDVKCGGPRRGARSLSGGNLQKFIVGREILQRPEA